MRKREGGFTLMEMLVVLFVIGVIIAIAVPNLSKVGDTASEKAEEANIKMLEAQAENYRLEKGEYPNSVSDLTDGEYIKEAPECQGDGEFQFEEDENGVFSVSCVEPQVTD